MTPTPTPQQIRSLVIDAGFNWVPYTNEVYPPSGPINDAITRLVTLALERFGQAPAVNLNCNTQAGADLKQRCIEILDWQRTGVLGNGALQAFADRQYPNNHHALHLAEAQTAREAYHLIATAPAVQQEPVAYVGSHWNDGTGFDVRGFRGKPPPVGTELYTHPAPAAVREPLTREQVQRMWREFSPLIGGIFHLVAAVEKHHGITGSKA